MPPILVALLVVALLFISCAILFTVFGLIGQNGRLLLRIEEIERALRHLRLVVPEPQAGHLVPNLLGSFLAAHPAVSLREGSMDHSIIDEIVNLNCYGLPPVFEPHDIVIDVGAHAGFFALAALDRGCGEVHCFEPNPENLVYAQRHLAPYGDRVRLTEAAVWRSDRTQPKLYFRPSVDSTNHGRGDVLQASGRSVTAVSFDEVLLQASRDATRRIRLVKLDCEGSEYPILLTSKLLHLVDEVCGEYHRISGDDSAAWDFGSDFSIESLRAHLEGHGFVVSCGNYPNSGSNALGLFIARRKN